MFIFIEIISYIYGKGKIFDIGGCFFEGYLWGFFEIGSDWVCIKFVIVFWLLF